MARRQTQKKGKKRIVVIGGGTGVFHVLSALKALGHHLTAIVTMADDGGSTGALRAEFGILPPGDVRRALVALSGAEKTLADLFTYRFTEGDGLEGHSVGNLLLTALERMTGSFERAVEEAGRILHIEGDVVPVTLDNVRLKAWLHDGSTVVGEHSIDVPPTRGVRHILRVALTPRPRANPKALTAIRNADLVVMGPGDLYTSILPNLVVPGITRALRESAATKLYFVNLVTKRGETDSFTARDFSDAVVRVVGEGVLDIVVVNSAMPSSSKARRYEKTEHASMVPWSREMFRNVSYRVVPAALMGSEGKLIRHDSVRLARVVARFL